MHWEVEVNIKALCPLLGLVAASTAMADDLRLTIDADYSGQGVYRYCPSVVDIDGVRHAFYCRNSTAYETVDSIYHATVSPSGALADETVVLSPADPNGEAWDSYHVCDPSVVAGRFWYNGRHYRYLMAYLGVKGRPGDSASDGYKCINNKVGFAVSDSLAGGWVRMGANCAVKTEHANSWGVGQPSLVSLDGAGKVALFYAGDYGTRMLELDFSNADATAASLAVRNGGAGTFVSTDGISDLKGTASSGMTITNGDFAWDRRTGCLYLSADTPDSPDSWYDDGGCYIFVTKSVTVYRAHLGTLSTSRIASAKWEKTCRIVPSDLDANFGTAFRIHNSGFLRNGRGGLVEKTTFASLAHCRSNALYTYRFAPVRWGSGMDWFDGGLGAAGRETWGGTWSPEKGAQESVIVLDGVDSGSVEFLADRTRRITKEGRSARIAFTATIEDVEALQPLGPEAKGGFSACNGEYWGVGADPDGGASNVWRRLSGKTPVLNSQVLVELEIFRLGRQNKVSYSVDGAKLGEFPIFMKDSKVSKVEFAGEGDISSLEGSAEGDWTEGLQVRIQ